MKNNIDAIKAGNYEVIASVRLDFHEYKGATPLHVFMNRLKRAGKSFLDFQNSHQMVLGLDDLTMSLIKPSISENQKHEVIVEGFNDPKLDLVMYDPKSIPEEFLEDINLAKAQLTTVISDANRIAKKLSSSSMSAGQIDNVVNNTQYPEHVRKMIGSMSGSKVELMVDDEVLTTGGHKLAFYCIEGTSQRFEKCEILEVTPKGSIVFDVSQLDKFQLSNGTDLLSVRTEVRPDSLQFRLLAFAYAAKLRVDIEVTFTKHVVKQQMKCWLVQILKLERLSEDISKCWIEVTQKLSLLD